MTQIMVNNLNEKKIEINNKTECHKNCQFSVARNQNFIIVKFMNLKIYS